MNTEEVDKMDLETVRASSGDYTLLDLLLLLVKYKKLIFAVTLVASILGACYSIILPNQYSARTLIVSGDEDKGMMGALMAQVGSLASIAGSAGVANSSKTDLYVTMLNTTTIQSAIVDRFKLMELYNAKFRVDAYKRLSRSSLIQVGRKDGVVTIQVEDTDPKRAAGIANAYVEELGKMVTQLNMVSAGNNRRYFEERLGQARADLARAEDAVKEFQSRNKAISVTDQARATIEGLAQLRGRLVLEEVQLAAYKMNLTDNSQEIRSANASIESLKRQIGKLEGSSVNSSIPGVGSVPALSQQYLRLMRDFKIQEVLVETLTKQYEMSKLSETKDVSPVQVLEKASVPERKSSPNRRKIILLSGVAAFFISVAAAFFMEFFMKLPEEKRKMFHSLVKESLWWR